MDELLGLLKNKGANDDKRFADMTQAVEALAGFAKNMAARVDEYAGKLDTASADLATEKNAHAATARKLDELTAKLSSQPTGGQRPQATGQGASRGTNEAPSSRNRQDGQCRHRASSHRRSDRSAQCRGRVGMAGPCARNQARERHGETDSMAYAGRRRAVARRIARPSPGHGAVQSRDWATSVECDRASMVASRHREARRVDSPRPSEGEEGDYGPAVGHRYCSAASATTKRAPEFVDSVFVHHGKPVYQTVTAAWRKALERAGIRDFRWHDLRHTWASWYVQRGTPLQVLKELGGWETMEMVQRYAALSADHLAQWVTPLTTAPAPMLAAI